MKLVKSKVRFDEEQHRYFLDEKELSGITGTLIKKAFPDTYKGIPDAVLAKAAERGSVVHQNLELFDTVCNSDINIMPSVLPEVKDYNEMLISYGLHHVDSEYLVSDNENFASAIDKVLADNEGNIYLADIKTTATLHYDNVSLQLSIYAKWFEEQNPDLKVKEIVCMWFKNGQSRFQPLPRVSDEQIEELIHAYPPEDADYQYVVEGPEQVSALEQEYRLVTARMDALKMKQDDLKEKIMKLMETNKKKSIKTSFGSYSYIAASTTKKFDSKLFKDTEPEHYEYYLKETPTKASIRIKLN